MILIKNVHIIDALISTHGDVLIDDGVIVKIAESIKCECETIDAQGYTLMPAFIDMHTHLRDPGFTYKEDLETGMRAALKGGYATLCTMANTNPVCDREEIFEYIKDKSQKLNLCEIKQISAVSRLMEGNECVDFKENIHFTKLFSDDGKTIFNENIMREALISSSKQDFTVLTHCDPEVEIIERDLGLLSEVGGNLHICHISLKDSLNIIKKYRDENNQFTVEVTPHHIFAFDNDYKVNPSIAKREDVESLIQGIKEGYIDVIGTDHAPHSQKDKLTGSPGISCIEVAFAMVNKVFKQNNIGLSKLSELMSYNPAKILGLNKGLINIGYDADLVLIDANKCGKINTGDFLSKGKNNPFDGKDIIGEVVMTIRKGSILYDNR